jgi:hypothetical protein
LNIFSIQGHNFHTFQGVVIRHKDEVLRRIDIILFWDVTCIVLYVRTNISENPATAILYPECGGYRFDLKRWYLPNYTVPLI